MDLLIWRMSSVEAQCGPVQKFEAGEIMLHPPPNKKSTQTDTHTIVIVSND